MNHTHHSRTHDKKTKPRKHTKMAAKKSAPPDARPTAKMPGRQSRKPHENEPPRNWDYADANTPEGKRRENGAGHKTSAPTSIGRVYGGENNVTAGKDDDRLPKPVSIPRSDEEADEDEELAQPTQH